jgi:hypothetical protein
MGRLRFWVRMDGLEADRTTGVSKGRNVGGPASRLPPARAAVHLAEYQPHNCCSEADGGNARGDKTAALDVSSGLGGIIG